MRKKGVYLALLVATLLLVLLLALATAGVGASPDTRYVSTTGSDAGNDCKAATSPCATIQHGIDVAQTGDEIHVAGGTYSGVGTAAVITKELTIIGAYGPDFGGPDPDMYPTVLDAQWGGSVISVTNAGDVLLQHLTLTHGDGTGNCGSDGCGGGIYARDTNLHVGHSVITDNVGSTAGGGMGGGVYAYDGHVDMWGSRIVSNTANTDTSSSSWSYGGGIYVNGGMVSLVENEILDNVGHVSYSGSGGGIYLYYVTQADVLTNTIRGNKAGIGTWGSDGGGLWLGYSSAAYVAGNRIENNWTNPNQAGYGGGVYVVQSDAHLSRNTIISNATGLGSGWVRPGGGISIGSNLPVTLTNNLIAENDAGIYGGGVYVSIYSPPIASRAVLVNNTVADNGDSGVVAQWYAVVTMTNNLIAGHATGLNTVSPFTGTISADTNLFWNTSDPIVGSNPILEAPLLTADYHLGSGSPAVDAGLTIPWLTTDIDGDPRPIGLGYDIGADERLLYQYLPLIMKNY